MKCIRGLISTVYLPADDKQLFFLFLNMITIGIIIALFALLFAVLQLGKLTGFCGRWFLYICISLALSADICFCNKAYGVFEIAVSLSLGFSVIFLLYILTSLLLRIKCAKIAICISDLVLTIISILPQIIRVAMGIQYFNEECFIILLQSNVSEGILFLYDNIAIAVAIVILILITVLASLNCKKTLICSRRLILYTTGIAMVMILSAFLSNGIHYASICIDNYIRKVAYLKRNVNADYSIFSPTSVDSLTCIVVMGESASRDYMSCYDYDTATTPHLKGWIESESILRFENTYSPDIKTVDCIPKALTSWSQFCDNIDFVLINLLKKNGFYTAWIGNQPSQGFNDNPVSILSEQADFRIFSEDVDGYDMNMLPIIHREAFSNVENDKKLIIVHLKGSHFPYDLTYDKNAPCDYIDAKSTLEHYENSLRYHDLFMDSLLTMVQGHDNVALFYTSDHGEKPGLSRMNDYFDFSMVRVPFMVYFSPNLRAKSQVYQILSSHRDSYWSNELLFNLVCGIAGITNDVILPLNCDLGSIEYDLTKDSFSHQNGRFKMSDDKYNEK